MILGCCWLSAMLDLIAPIMLMQPKTALVRPSDATSINLSAAVPGPRRPAPENWNRFDGDIDEWICDVQLPGATGQKSKKFIH
jgi:hypothetical protein